MASAPASEELMVLSVFNLRELIAYIKATDELTLELLFSSDYALFLHIDDTLQSLVNDFTDTSNACGLKEQLKHQLTLSALFRFERLKYHRMLQ